MTDSQDEPDGGSEGPSPGGSTGDRGDRSAGRSPGGSSDDTGDEAATGTVSESRTGNATDRETGGDADEEPVVDPEIVGVPRRLEGRVRYLWILGSTVGAIVAGVVVGFSAAVFLDEYVWAGAVVAALLFLLGIVRAVLLYRSWRYYVREESLFLRRGVLTRVQTVVPYVRVQHIDTRRSPLERALGLSSLVVYTAGSRGADVTIPGLTPDRADTLQSRLERLAIASEEEAV